jgi:hypothetical protein
MDDEHIMKISHLRDSLGWAYQQVAQTDIPIVVQRYGRKDAILVPAWEWQFFKELEAGIKAGRCPIGCKRGKGCSCSLSK